jgi:hypothetical protein
MAMVKRSLSDHARVDGISYNLRKLVAEYI